MSSNEMENLMSLLEQAETRDACIRDQLKVGASVTKVSKPAAPASSARKPFAPVNGKDPISAFREKMASQQQELNSLREELIKQRSQSQQESDASAARIREVEVALKRSVTFANSVVADKDRLTNDVLSLKQQLAERDEKEVAMVAEAKKKWDRCEKRRREEWQTATAAKLQQQTLKAVQPEVQALIAKHRAEREAIEQTARKEVAAADERAKISQRAVDELSAAHRKSLDASAATARESLEKALSEQAERFQQQLETERASMQREKATAMACIESERATYIREAERLQSLVSEAKAREDDAKRALREETAAAAMRVQESVTSAADERRRVMEKEFEAMRKAEMARIHAETHAERERMRASLKAEADAAVAEVVETFEGEVAAKTAAAARAAEKATSAEACAERLRKQIERLEADAVELRAQLCAAREEADIHRRTLETEREAVAAMDAKRLRGLIPELESKDRERDEAIAAMRKVSDERVDQLEKAQSEEMRKIRERVAQTLSARDKTIETLRERLAAAEGRCEEMRAAMMENMSVASPLGRSRVTTSED